MRTFFLDFETYSSEDLVRAGVHRYVESDDFEILLLSYAFDTEPVTVYDWYHTGAPPWLGDVLTDPDVIKVAHNCSFERTCFAQVSGMYLPPEQWRDTMTLCAMNGLPMALDEAGKVLGLENQKLGSGKALITYFSRPCKPTKANGMRTRNMPDDDPLRWAQYVEYNGRDTESEREIWNRLKSFPVPDWEHRLEAVDARINERGVLIDRAFVEAAVSVDETVRAAYRDELRRLTGLENPNSVTQLKTWLSEHGAPADSLNKESVKELRGTVRDPTVLRVLELRQLLGKTSTSKYTAMLDAACGDDRVRGMLQYYGAGRTGRWAGRRVQVQNLAQNHLDDLDGARELVRSRDTELLSALYDSVPDVLSQLIRTAFIARKGCTFLVADYSAIEARVIAYLAGEQWRMDVFANGGDIYCASASKMFKVPVVKHGENGHLRQKGKIAELALGYGGGTSALVAFGADKMGLTMDEMQEIVTSWRGSSPMIVQLWRRVEDAARRAIENPGRRVTVMRKYRDAAGAAHNEALTGRGGYPPDFMAGGEVCSYWRDKDALRCRLPSGRVLSYRSPGQDDEGLFFYGQNQTTGQWERIKTWGGRLVENIVQAFARDCLAVAMTRLDAEGWHICFHVHDEVIVEAPDGSRWEDVAEVMGRPIEWAPGLLLRGDGYETKYYKKD